MKMLSLLYLQIMNLPKQTGRFSISTQFPYYRETFYMPDFSNMTRGKPVIFDMDMSVGDFLSLIYLLKAPLEAIDLKVSFFFPFLSRVLSTACLSWSII